MSHKLKLFIIYFASFFILFMGIRYLIGYILPNIDHLYQIMIAAAITVIFSPKLDKVQTENGSRYQLKWLFRKKPIIK